MRQDMLDGMVTFVVVAEEKSFSAAAIRLGVSPSAISQTISKLESRLRLPLFNRTTRSVSLTEAGSRYLERVLPALNELAAASKDLDADVGKPAGLLRLNVLRAGYMIAIQPLLRDFLDAYPDIQVEVKMEASMNDIVAEGFDAGARLGETLPQDMIAVPFGGEGRFIVVAAPDYLERHGTPKTPDDLAQHRCIRFRMPSGKMYRWEFERHGQPLKVDVGGRVTLDHLGLMVDAAAKGLGLAFVAAETARAETARGRLVSVLDDWTPPFAGWHLYYPGNRLVPGALRAFLDVLKAVERERKAPASRRRKV